MIIKTALLATLVFASSPMVFAQSKTKTIAPNVLVKNLYAAQKAGSGPIVQVKSRALHGQVKLVEILTTAIAAASQTPAGESEVQSIQGKLQVGKTKSVIVYVGMESGDYAAYCFTNDSEAGRKILAVCKNGKQCAVKGTVTDGECKVPGLEADLSFSARIVKVRTVKLLSRKK